MGLDKMVLLKEYGTLGEAEVAKSMLDSLGICSMINNEYMSTLHMTGAIPIQLIVLEEDLTRSRSALEQVEEV